MAIVKIDRKVYNGIARVSIQDSNDKDVGILKILSFTGIMESIPFKKCKHIRVECKSDNQLQSLQSQNCATVIGNIEYAKVQNCMNVEGKIEHITKCGNQINLDKGIKVTYGNKTMKGTRAKVIHIDGKLLGYKDTITGQSIENVIIGDVNEVQVDDRLNVKGTVRNCVVVNNINCSNTLK